MRRDHPPFVTRRFDAIGAGVRACACVRGGVRARSGFGTARGPVRRVVTFFWNFFFARADGSGPRFGTSSVRDLLGSGRRV